MSKQKIIFYMVLEIAAEYSLDWNEVFTDEVAYDDLKNRLANINIKLG